VQTDQLHVEMFGRIVAPWRLMFLFGIAPAVLALLVRRRLKEPERWKQAIAAGQVRKAGSYAELFGDPRWRKNALVGLALAFSGVVGLWAIGFFSGELVQNAFGKVFDEEGLTGNARKGQIMIWTGLNQLMLNIGAFFGIYAFSRVTHYTGRKPAFAISFVLAMVSTAAVFWFLRQRSDIFWMIPLMGFCQLATFGGYAIYFPELFPTRLRSTGTSFCYNVGRFVAASGPSTVVRTLARSANVGNWIRAFWKCLPVATWSRTLGSNQVFENCVWNDNPKDSQTQKQYRFECPWWEKADVKFVIHVSNCCTESTPKLGQRGQRDVALNGPRRTRHVASLTPPRDGSPPAIVRLSVRDESSGRLLQGEPVGALIMLVRVPLLILKQEPVLG
jgi:MFS family permease